MNNIILTTQNETLTSLEVAGMVHKDHKYLMRDIRRYTNQLGESKIAPTDFWQESTYTTEQNKELPCYNITRKGCEFIANKLTGQKGTEFTARYVNRFHELEEGNVTNSLINALDLIMERLHIKETESKRKNNIFDELAAKVNQNNIDNSNQ